MGWVIFDSALLTADMRALQLAAGDGFMVAGKNLKEGNFKAAREAADRALSVLQELMDMTEGEEDGDNQ